MTSIEIENGNQVIAKTVAECLNKHYPGHAWAVNADIEKGIVTVHNMRLSGQWGFVLKMDELNHDPSMKLTIRAGGELLERYNLSRRSANETEYQDIVYDFKGDAVQA